MTKPNYYIEVQGEGVSCLGSQLKEILELIKLHPYINHATWYAADVDSSPIPECIRNFGDIIPRKVGNTRDMIAICQHVPQFLSGVFSALSKDAGDQLKDVGDQFGEGFETDDESFRDIGDAVLEIRAFDTSWFEIYANDYDLIRLIAEKFQVKIFTEETIEHPRRYG
jgi:hypothetical protein